MSSIIRKEVIRFCVFKNICTRCHSRRSETGKRFCTHCLVLKNIYKRQSGEIKTNKPYKPWKIDE